MAEAPNNTHNKRLLIRTSHVCHRRRAAGRNQQVKEYKHTHKHTHTHTHTHTHRGTHQPFSSTIVRKDKKNLEESITGTNVRMKNYCSQKSFGKTKYKSSPLNYKR